MDIIAEAANHFRYVVRTELADHVKEIDKRNRAYDPGTCATHDFSDANMLMQDAICQVFRCHEDQLLSWDDEAIPQEVWVPVWNAAWNLARTKPFSSTELVY